MSLVVRVAVAVSVLAVVLVCAAGFLIRWPVTDPALRVRILKTIETSSGLSADVEGPISLVLLPRPTVKLRSVHMASMAGAITLDATSLTGVLGLTSLLAGTAKIVSTTLDEPTVAIDLDRILPILSLATAPPSATASRSRDAILALFRTEALTLHAGVVRIRSSDPRLDTLVTGVDATWEWPAADASASLDGRLTWRSNPVEGALMVDDPVAVLGGGLSRGFARFKSPLLDVEADAMISGRVDRATIGKVSARTASLPGFLRMIGTPLVALNGIGTAAIGGAMTIENRTLALSDARLTLGTMLFEGAMAFHDDNGHPGVAGTLATDDIDLAPFLSALPWPWGPDGRWSDAPLATASVAFDEVDLRVSASHARVGALEFEDGGLSLQSGSGRMEISLGEARAYDGLFKGRVVAQLEGDRTAVRADATFSQLNLGALAADLGQSHDISGTSTGHATLEGSGVTPAGLIASLSGRGQVVVRNGDVGPALVASAMRPEPSANGRVPALPNNPVSFDSALLGFEAKAGVVSATEGWLLRPDLRAVLRGGSDLARQTIEAQAGLTPIGDDLQGQTGPQVTLSLSGPWTGLRVRYSDRADAIPATAGPAR